MTEYIVLKQSEKTDYWEAFFEVFGYSSIDAVEKIANAETGEIGFQARGAGRYMVVARSRVDEHDVEETPRYRVKKRTEDEYH
jgi:hypothetical protein